MKVHNEMGKTLYIGCVYMSTDSKVIFYEY